MRRTKLFIHLKSSLWFLPVLCVLAGAALSFGLERVPERVVAPYALRPPTPLHYLAAPATEQKVKALALRNETQARDVFDLDLLFREHPGVVERDPGAGEGNRTLTTSLKAQS